MVTYPTPSPPPGTFTVLKTVYSFLSWSIVWFFKSKTDGFRSKSVFGTMLAFNGVGKQVRYIKTFRRWPLRKGLSSLRLSRSLREKDLIPCR